ncbi:MAG TPA: hypothetical protein VFB54_06835 [Burkholderiales bacterium]|nr:hypothetical protein [Burkholderiales bacterium]
MTTIVAGRFENVTAAEQALRALTVKGFREEDTSEFFVNPPGQHGTHLPGSREASVVGGDQFADAQSSTAHEGAAAGAAAGGLAGVAAAAAIPGIGPVVALGVAALGAYTGSFVGTMSKLGDSSRAAELDASPGRPAGAMVAVRVLNDEAERVALDTLRSAGALDIERREGEWREGQWVDFDPLSPPAVVTKTEDKT